LTRPPVVTALAMVLVLCTCSIARGFPRSNQPLSAWLDRNGPDAPNYPCAAADFLDQHIDAQTHHLICEFTWGGYLEWRLGPHFQTLMDGRTQLFSPQFWNTIALGTDQQRRAFLAATPADAAIVQARHNAIGQALKELGWKTVYKDNFAEVLIPAEKAEAPTAKSD
jgi:hypothetical protein